MALRKRTWKRAAAERLSNLLDRCERLAGRRFYELHLAAAAVRHRRGLNKVEIGAGPHRLRFRTPSAKALWRAETLLTKEPGTIEWIDSFEATDVFWDIGANLGVYSLYAGKVKGIKTVAFEPASFNYGLLWENIRLNGLESLLSAYEIAFAERSRLGQLSIGDDEPGAAFASIDAARNLLAQTVLIFTVDDFIRFFSPPFPTHIKIDVDGLEQSVIEGAYDTLSDPRVKSMSVEVDEEKTARRIDDILTSHGYRLVKEQVSPLAPTSSARNRRYVRD